MFRSLSLLALLSFCVLLADSAEFDFSKGSDERLFESFSDAGELYYAQVVDGYREECAKDSATVDLAVERCRFIENFLYSEDFYYDATEGDYEEAKSFLDTRFKESPAAILYALEDLVGEDFYERVDELGRQTNRWSAKLRSEYYLMIAGRKQWDEGAKDALGPAALAYRSDANPETAKLYASLLVELDKKDEVWGILESVDFSQEKAWLQREVMDLYLGIDQVSKALEIYERIQDSDDVYFSKEKIAELLALQGNLEKAREVLFEEEIQEWNREQILLARLSFELKYGDLEGAVAAYEAYREIGWSVDPFGRKWMEVALAFGEVPWSAFKVSGLLASLGLLLLFIAFPLIFIVPVHYWSLSRILSGKVSQWSFGAWGLRWALGVCSALMGAELILMWWESEWNLRDLFDFETSVLTSDPTLSTLVYTNLSVLVSLLVLGFALAKTRSWSVLGLGKMSIGRAIGFTVLAMIGFRILATVHVWVFPEIKFSASENLTTLMMHEIFDAYGLAGLWLHVGLLGPIIEEVLFRGVLLSAFSKRIPFWAANLFQASLFTLSHEDYRLAAFYLVFGLVCGWFVKRAGGLGPSILLHALNNSLVCVGLWLLWGLH